MRPAAYGVAIGLHFGPQPARAVALAVARRRLAHGGLPGRFRNQPALLSVPRVVRAGRDLQDLAELGTDTRARRWAMCW